MLEMVSESAGVMEVAEGREHRAETDGAPERLGDPERLGSPHQSPEQEEQAKPVQVVAPFREDNEVAQAEHMLQCVGTDYMDRKRNNLLHQCVPTRSPLAVYVYANAGVPVNAQNTSGETPLHLAVQSGNIELIRAMLQCGASPLVRNKMGQTAFDLLSNKRAQPLCEQFQPGLVNAIERGNFGALKRLLRLHCSLDTVVKDGMTGLELARSLAEKSPHHNKCYQRAVIQDIFTNRLFHRVLIQDVESARTLLQSGRVAVNSRYKNHLGRTPLVSAIERDDVAMVKLLLDHEAAVNIRVYQDDESGLSVPVPHLVSRRTCPGEIVRAVVDRAHNYITEKDAQRGFTILHKAIAANADLSIIEYLCTVHDSTLLYTRDEQGRLPRELAQEMQRAGVVRIIDEVTRTLPMATLLIMMVNFYGLDNFNFDDEKKIKMAQICEEKGRRQLEAAVSGDADTVLGLMTGDYRDQHGHTALTRAIACNRYDLVQAMINKQHRLKLVPDNSNRYPLHYAYALPEELGAPFVTLLLQTDPEQQEFLHDKDGRQPADYIQLRDSTQIQNMLRQARTNYRE